MTNKEVDNSESEYIKSLLAISDARRDERRIERVKDYDRRVFKVSPSMGNVRLREQSHSGITPAVVSPGLASLHQGSFGVARVTCGYKRPVPLSSHPEQLSALAAWVAGLRFHMRH